MLKLIVLGNYAPNLRFKPGTSYLITGLSKNILLDCGNGTIRYLLKYIKKNHIDLSSLTIIISHNHFDHCADLINLAYVLKVNKKKLTIYIPHKSVIYDIVKKFRNVFDVKTLNETTHFSIDNADFTFCRTPHCGESYSTKICINKKIFVYTSDLPYVTDKLKTFINNADIALIDCGNPYKYTSISLKNYHGQTTEIVNSIFNCNVKKVFASHLKAYLNKIDYINSFPKNKDVQLVFMNNEYNIF